MAMVAPAGQWSRGFILGMAQRIASVTTSCVALTATIGTSVFSR